ncbi:hypothetical protein [Pseudobdellovibrio exovorus]|uniref:Uncharacterized protein n=1 Tax=Pseudobdellovibrio exovorus JSS TaxID=1184267 RepID=M4V5N3_9BACT|nr:hypothetical protein [Pseudobdellovibrio exovorus]AGH94473.1 hypothetical protein A11Q_253 [Pseudobdellovibrio exovorus JSS]
MTLGATIGCATNYKLITIGMTIKMCVCILLSLPIVSFAEMAKKPSIYYFPQTHRKDAMTSQEKNEISQFQADLYDCLEEFGKEKNIFLIAEGRSPFHPADLSKDKTPERKSEAFKDFILEYTAAHVLIKDQKVNGSPEYDTEFWQKLNKKAQRVVNKHHKEIATFSKATNTDLAIEKNARFFVIGGGCTGKDISCSSKLKQESLAVRDLRLKNLRQLIKKNKKKKVALVKGSFHFKELGEEYELLQFYSESCKKYLDHVYKSK